MAFWHTHPGNYSGLGGEDSFGQGGFFSDGDYAVADGYTGTDPETKSKKFFPHRLNKKAVPLTLTRSDGVGGVETFAYQGGDHVQYVQDQE